MITGKVLRVLLVNEIGQITSIIEDHVEGLSVFESSNGLIDAPEVLLLRLPLPCEDRNTRGGDAR